MIGSLSALRDHLVQQARVETANYVQYEERFALGREGSFALVVLTKDVDTKGGERFKEGDFALMDVERGGGYGFGDTIVYYSLWSWRDSILVRVALSDFRVVLAGDLVTA